MAIDAHEELLGYTISFSHAQMINEAATILVSWWRWGAIDAPVQLPLPSSPGNATYSFSQPPVFKIIYAQYTKRIDGWRQHHTPVPPNGNTEIFLSPRLKYDCSVMKGIFTLHWSMTFGARASAGHTAAIFTAYSILRRSATCQGRQRCHASRATTINILRSTHAVGHTIASLYSNISSSRRRSVLVYYRWIPKIGYMAGYARVIL